MKTSNSRHWFGKLLKNVGISVQQQRSAAGRAGSSATPDASPNPSLAAGLLSRPPCLHLDAWFQHSALLSLEQSPSPSAQSAAVLLPNKSSSFQPRIGRGRWRRLLPRVWTTCNPTVCRCCSANATTSGPNSRVLGSLPTVASIVTSLALHQH